MPTHHEIFKKFELWQGHVEAGYSVNFLGVITRDMFFQMSAKHPEKRFVTTQLPMVSEEYFEWIDLLESVIAAKDRFTMIELGAGYGRWLVNAVAALRAANNLSYSLIGVEPEPMHYKYMEMHFKDNGVDLSKCQLIEAAASENDGSLWFYVGRPDEWYGQAIAPKVTGSLLHRIRASLTKRVMIGNDEVRKVKAISLNTLLQPLERVDLIDLDVQGAELDVLAASREQLDSKVKRVHIGTHEDKIEDGLRKLFLSLGWENLNDYANNCEYDTPYGRVKFQDGVQSWINRRLL